MRVLICILLFVIAVAVGEISSKLDKLIAAAKAEKEYHD